MNFEKIPSLIAVATFAALSVVVASEWGYFGVIGSEFQSLFTTYDYISNLIVSLGPAFVILATVLAIQVAIHRSSDFDIRNPASSKWGKWIYDWQLELLWGISFVLALLFSDQTRRHSLYILAGLFWIRIVNYILSYEKLKEFSRTAVGLSLLLLPAAMIYMIGEGRDQAYRDLEDTKDQYRLLLKDKNVAQNVKLLRAIEKGAIVLNHQSKTVEFHPRETIVQLDRDMPSWETKSFVCRKLNWLCGKA